jgi:hypothetical protein
MAQNQRLFDPSVVDAEAQDIEMAILLRSNEAFTEIDETAYAMNPMTAISPERADQESLNHPLERSSERTPR